jgi:NitT/TauT family transport system ATP-binding protein
MLNVSRLTKRFGELSVLDEFDLNVPRKGFTILIGPSGCGKSTLFDVLTGVVPKNGGNISWLNQSVPHLGMKSAYMQQKDLLLPWFTLMDNALLPARISGDSLTPAAEKAMRLFSRLGLEGFETYYPREISGGMRQRCALVRTLMFEHELVLLDEPLSALDAITRRSLQSLLVLLQSEFDKTILMITHDIEEALVLADEVLVLSRMPMEIVQRFSLQGPKPRSLTETHLIEIKEVVLHRLQGELKI